MNATMESFTNDALIERWVAAYIWANGKTPDQVPAYENGWFVWRNSAFVTSRSRRKHLVEMIVRLIFRNSVGGTHAEPGPDIGQSPKQRPKQIQQPGGRPPRRASEPPRPTRDTLHKQLIRRLLAENPALQTSGFKRAVDAIFLASDDEDTFPHNIRPDAYSFDRNTETIVLYEVVDRHELSEEKLDQYIDLAWALSAEGWDVKIIKIDRHWRWTTFDLLVIRS